MHELGIANSILNAVRTEMMRNACARALKVGVRIGPLAGIDRDSLSFCFNAITKDTDFAELALDLQDGTDDELDFSYMELEEE